MRHPACDDFVYTPFIDVSKPEAVDKEEAIEAMKAIIEKASPEYLNPGPELFGKYLVFKDYKFISQFDTKSDALDFANNRFPEIFEIKRTIETDEGPSTETTIPGAIQYNPDKS